ncbi:MAG TPA: single-stranded-DNA-specific exonuclease RecJ [Candidatus Moranbacteria bacterium]|nr:single-stranded-DNA-specific exonuclease RecJ [Candidatus Moranbacteria bacterium]
MAEWKIKNKDDGKNQIVVDKYNPLILALLRTRGIRTQEEIESFFQFDYEKDLTDPMKVSGMEKAVGRIEEAKKNKEKITIFGDYDADGVTATALLFDVLEELEFENVNYYIPDRQIEGYGLNEEAIKFLKSGGTDLIITVDCGITAVEEVEMAKKLGMDVIITDHHHVPDKLPGALAVINPHLPNSGFKFEELAGVGVAFKLAQAVYKKMAPDKIDQLKWALDLVAIGTIADCVNLLGENRVLVRYGLIVLSKTKRIGLQEMFKVGRIDISEDKIPDTHKIAFQIAPRINAAGRMDHASVSYKLIIEKNRVKAREMALEVEVKNQDRQKITSQIVKEVEILAINSFKDKKFIFAQNEHWPVGILGLVAGKIADKFKKPTIVLQHQEKELVGSLRSIPEINIMEVLEECSDALERFGGHAQAAGVRLKKEKADRFYEKFERAIEKKAIKEKAVLVLEADLEIRAEDVDWEFVKELKMMEPFGMGNAEPVFVMKNLIIEDMKIVGNGNKHLKMSVRAKNGNPKIFDSIGFSMGDKFSDLKKGDVIDVVTTLSEDEWNGNKKIQLKLIDIRKSNL